MRQRVRFRRKADIAIPTQGHKRGDMGIAREWNLTWRLRLAVVCCALGYLLFARPWSEPSPSIAVDAYMCSAAILTLALIPRHTRLWVTFCLALAVAGLAKVALDFLRT